MRIKQLDISGFKSFCDPVRVKLDSSVTAVVGPNGCGKSNIVDALRWTLGETSAKALRGSAMEDVIFNGSENRGPKSMAEVTITFDNTDGLSHPSYIDFTEVSVTRRLHRDGTSEYLINKVPCRKKDITDLFLGTGGGARAYSIVEQGRIGLIVSARSEDRRLMIEEAAGITKYKSARRTSERKMDQTRQNLLRVSDITAEMERNLASLNRQAKKAERYKQYREEQTDLELHVASHQYLKLRAETMALHAMYEQKEQALDEAKGKVATAEARVQSLRLEADSVKALLDEQTAQGYEIDSNLSVQETEIRHLLDNIKRCELEQESLKEQLRSAEVQGQQFIEEKSLIESQMERVVREREAAQVRFGELTAETAEARERLETLGEAHDEKRDEISRSRSLLAASDTAIENLARRIDEIDARLEAVHEEREALEREAEALSEKAEALSAETAAVTARLEEARATEERERNAYILLKEQVEACDTERAQTNEMLQKKRSRKQSLEELIQGLEGHDSAVREAVQLLEKEGEDLVTGLIVEAVASEEQYEQAVAAAFGDRLQALMVKDRPSGLRVLEMLKERDMARVAVAAPCQFADGKEARRITDPRVLGPLTEFVRCDSAVESLVGKILRNVFLVSTLEEAETLYGEHGGKVAFVTLDGQLLEAGGVMRGGRAKTVGATLLAQQREIRKLTEEVATLEAEHAALDRRFHALKDELHAKNEASEAARAQAQSEEIALAEIRKDSARLTDDTAAIGRRRDALEREIAHQNEMLVQARTDREHAVREAEAARARIEAVERELHAGYGEIEACRREVDRLTAAASDVRVQKASLDQQWESAIQRTDQLGHLSRELGERTEILEERERTTYQSLGKAAGEVVRRREALAAHLEVSEKVRAEIAELRRRVDAAGLQVTEAEAGVKADRVVVDAISQQVSDMEMKKREAVLSIGHLLEQVDERNNCNLLRVIGDFHMRDEPGADVFSRVEELRKLINRMGPINLAAIDEFKAESERYEQLAGQKADLEQALEDLERAIAKMDRDSKRRFKETFEEVNARFKEIFPRLFKGGSAYLKLTDPDDMLLTGVEIIAQPPGKRVGSNELLSGGEKALTAVSLLFAIFLHRPSPFCILDEVDAPLDEANIARFVDMVHEMTDRSQFIIITHSKITMEKSDALYGITMEEPGISKLVSVKLTKTKRRILQDPSEPVMAQA